MRSRERILPLKDLKIGQYVHGEDGWTCVHLIKPAEQQFFVRVKVGAHTVEFTPAHNVDALDQYSRPVEV